ncbi:two-component sensor histidine kinase [Lentzea sp. NBRC 105346]|uniref:sensor histidine kinase n=1 Tax=Lentzea sp. NBRC 105346 TaxID=3032205 RepID=UPI0024A432DF|nr:sensor histidine kinase [Lentzea sp. NBRC 105346]GLZ35199.1 two-component sensor histidine kinase [Lentzea sp. NBRC 105346]
MLPDVREQLVQQSATVLSDVAAAVAHCPAEPQPVLSGEIGANRAGHAIHPLESVRAAVALFEVTLPVVVEELHRSGHGEPEVLEASRALHRSIMARIAQGSVAYASYLLKKVNSSHEDERHRIARELHDRVAHSVGNALQHLQLHDVYVTQDPDRARAKLKAAQDVLNDAFDVIRHLATELRESAAEAGGLEVALCNYLDAHAPFGMTHTVTVTGDVTNLPSEVVEELYLVLREAARNALLHAGPKRVDVEIDATGGQLQAVVRDDGCGFDTHKLGLASGIGLESMRERVELLGGTLSVTSVLGEGTTVTVSLPWLDDA